MNNYFKRLIQSALIGIICTINGMTYKSLTFWLIILVMAIQWAKENDCE